jgi:hypothetical protein
VVAPPHRHTGLYDLHPFAVERDPGWVRVGGVSAREV